MCQLWEGLVGQLPLTSMAAPCVGGLQEPAVNCKGSNRNLKRKTKNGSVICILNVNVKDPLVQPAPNPPAAETHALWFSSYASGLKITFNACSWQKRGPGCTIQLCDLMHVLGFSPDACLLPGFNLKQQIQPAKQSVIVPHGESQEKCSIDKGCAVRFLVGFACYFLTCASSSISLPENSQPSCCVRLSKAPVLRMTSQGQMESVGFQEPSAVTFPLILS